ncbi:DUF3817 domain-containing protein [Marinitenerispora sediminis]|uniref:DUF3817 domain-containing protein n=1 Tax=Marinitenerispora sediminis TaxID=1931232 RepID=A0A368T948_9ACTN|nr:DUF3817 domain-containing protein [Marinitenerispora sediminis]RCV51727.1 DUF3817 domain-containing protein [Marinitenerispora sediminis]RCV55110.1 DUF3817 domain-containing protein [Marinitenerispora sediminis]RCV59075.1 DUF3817 domain-containing protein [Marinitenerispora sediminis]
MTVRPRKPLRVAAAVELLTLVVMLGNLATAHLPEISSLAGPTHGCAYLFTVIAVARDPRRSWLAAGLALLPGIGGLLALHRLTRADGRAEQAATG